MPNVPSSQEKSLVGQVAVVTGAAKRIGQAIALHLAQQGADVVVHYHTSKKEAAGTVEEIKKLGRRAVAIQADLRSVTEIRHLVQEVSSHFGQLNILVNSAANFLPANLEATTDALWDASLDTNLKAPFFCAQAAAPLLKQTHGTIINLADVGGILAWPAYIPHCVSKAGVIMLTKCLAKALAPDVRVNAIAPGTITMEGDPSDWEKDYIRRAPLHRTGTTQDVAEAVSFLIHSTFITGQTLILDGGRTI